jgi:hypothetical protein
MGERKRNMRILSEEEFQAEAASPLHEIFACEDPFGQPFAVGVRERRLLYPIGLTLTNLVFPLLEAIIAAAQEVGDRGFYLSVIERPAPQNQDVPYHWYFHFSELNEYDSLNYAFVLEHVLYSPDGRWGIMLSHEQHALLGGSSAFVDSMCKIIPGFDDLKQVLTFLSDWKYYATGRGADVSWIPGLLTQVYGAQTAQQLLAEASFTDLL